MIAPGLYVGAVMHRRLVAPPHRFLYDHFWVAVDLDAPAPATRLFSRDRANLFSLLARDHADGKPGDLRAKIAALAPALDLSGPMILLATPRLFGFVFNPLSVYFCHGRDGRPSAIAWEVSNTFGARHTYVIAVAPGAGRLVRQSCAKRLHVSPFLPMSFDYRFRVEADADRFVIGIVDQAREGPALVAAWTAARRDLTDAALLGLLARAPLATFRIVAAIHWEALKLWRKGAKFRRAPPGSEQPIAAHGASLHLAPANLSPMNATSEAAE